MHQSMMTFRPAEDVIVLLGYGNLAGIKIVPAIFYLWKERALKPGTAILVVDRHNWEDEDLKREVKKAVAEAEKWLGVSEDEIDERFLNMFRYVKLNLTNPESYKELTTRVADLRKTRRHGTILYYLAVAPSLYPSILTGISSMGAEIGDNPNVHLVVEKPLGKCLSEVKDLLELVERHFKRALTLYMDHYLQKEGTLGLPTQFWLNAQRQALMKAPYMSFFEFSALEAIPVAPGRLETYKQMGAVADMLPHLLSVISLAGIEAPHELTPGQVRAMRENFLSAVDLSSISAILGAYEGFDYGMPTYAAIEFCVKNDLWKGHRPTRTKFGLRTGKNLQRKGSRLALTFEVPDLHFITQLQEQGMKIIQNQVVITIDPFHQVVSYFNQRPRNGAIGFAAEPGFMASQVRPGDMGAKSYAIALHNALIGDGSFFPSATEILRQWKIIQYVLNLNSPIHKYKPGSWGPDAANAIPWCLHPFEEIPVPTPAWWTL